MPFTARARLRLLGRGGLGEGALGEGRSPRRCRPAARPSSAAVPTHRHPEGVLRHPGIGRQLHGPLRHLGQVPVGGHVVEVEDHRGAGVEVGPRRPRGPTRCAGSGAPPQSWASATASSGPSPRRLQVGGQLDRPRHEGGVGLVAPPGGVEVVDGERPHGLERPVAPAVALEAWAGSGRPGARRRPAAPPSAAGSPATSSRPTQPLGGGEVDAAGEHGDARRAGARRRRAAPGTTSRSCLAGCGDGRRCRGDRPRTGRGRGRAGRAGRAIVSAPDAAGRQLEGERQPVESPGDVGHEDRVARRWASRSGCAAAGVGEERVDGGDADSVGGALLGDRERSEPHEVLGGQPEGPAGGRHQGEVAAGVDEAEARVPAVRQHVLAVVEHEDGLAGDQRVAGRAPRPRGRPTGRSPRAAATTAGTRRSSVTAASSTTMTCGPASAASAAASSARRVLPTPPGPTTVTRRSAAIRRRSAARSCSRPTHRRRRPGARRRAVRRCRRLGRARATGRRGRRAARPRSGRGRGRGPSRPPGGAGSRGRRGARRPAGPAAPRTRTSRAWVDSRSGASAAARVASATSSAIRRPGGAGSAAGQACRRATRRSATGAAPRGRWPRRPAVATSGNSSRATPRHSASAAWSTPGSAARAGSPATRRASVRSSSSGPRSSR